MSEPESADRAVERTRPGTARAAAAHRRSGGPTTSASAPLSVCWEPMFRRFRSDQRQQLLTTATHRVIAVTTPVAILVLATSESR
ncbi:hypothetical protein AB0C69_09300 [Actinomadura sp. NPDC048032]|uniref:hypothetical protein n=1 Tax=Actinomadura sp. NPDC048032 TaxID=3155747 RepID=UPI0034011F44